MHGICHGYRWQMPCISLAYATDIPGKCHACFGQGYRHYDAIEGASVNKNTYQVNGYEVADAYTSADEMPEDSAASDFTAPSRFLLW